MKTETKNGEKEKKKAKKSLLPRWAQDLLFYGALITFLLCAAVGVLTYGKNRDAKSGELTVYFLDVGQGDSTLLVLPDGQTVLVDAAEAENADDVCRALLAHGITHIDTFVLTHPHNDHGGGALQVAERFGFSRIWMTETDPSYVGGELLSYAAKANVSVGRFAAGTVICDGAVRIEALNPVADRTASAENPDSGVLLVTFGETRMLLMGDADASVEQNLRVGEVDLLRVGHHGSDTSTTMPFLLETAPRYAVISVGIANDYGHPHYAVLARLADCGATVFRTDLDGEITARSDGKTLTVTKSEEKPTLAVARDGQSRFFGDFGRFSGVLARKGRLTSFFFSYIIVSMPAGAESATQRIRYPYFLLCRQVEGVDYPQWTVTVGCYLLFTSCFFSAARILPRQKVRIQP